MVVEKVKLSPLSHEFCQSDAIDNLNCFCSLAAEHVCSIEIVFERWEQLSYWSYGNEPD
jgi:hypothetical protein